MFSGVDSVALKGPLAIMDRQYFESRTFQSHFKLMENDKDNSLGHLLDSSKVHAETLLYFRPSASRERLVRKIEQLATALFLITAYLEPADELGRKLRTKSLELISQGTKSNWRGELEGGTRELRALVSLGEAVGAISPMNSGILLTEFTKLSGLLTTSFAPEHLLPSGLFRDAQKDINDTSMSNTLATGKPQGHAFNKGQSKGQSQGHNQQEQFTAQRKDLLPSERQHAILELLRLKPSLTVKDVALVISKVSEKTLQRELAALVAEGILRREGERRWTRYSLSH
jgi:hypothetical protein